MNYIHRIYIAGRTTLKSGLLLVACLLCSSSAMAQTPLGTSFSYQGLLQFEGNHAEGLFDLRFRLYDGADPDSAFLLGTQTLCNQQIHSGLLAVELDFGDVFSAGEKIWLEVSAFEAGDCTSFINLTPLQPIGGAPFAHFAPESDPTVAVEVKDGVSWSEVEAIPAGFADGIDNVVTTEQISCYSTDWGDRSDCAFGNTIRPAPVPSCDAGYSFFGLAEVAVSPTDCNNWTANVRLRVKSLCCRIE